MSEIPYLWDTGLCGTPRQCPYIKNGIVMAEVDSPASNITKISEWRHKDTIEALEYLLEMAKRGEITGFIYGVRVGDWHHGIGVTGHYRADPIAGLGAAGRIFATLNRLAEQESQNM